MARTTAPLVGRSAELADLTAALRASALGAGAGIVVGGDAGVGKTRLLTELTTVAAADGARCLMGHCVDLGDTPPPYLPFTEAFTRLAGDEPAVVDELAAAFPALSRLLPGRQAAGVSDDRVDRGDLFDAVRGALVQLAVDRPVAFFVEDVHWADRATRDLLGFLFTRLDAERMALVVTFRSDDLHRRHPLRRTLAEWSRLPHVSRVTLDPLPSDDVQALVRSISAGLAHELTEEDVEAIVRRADGNAFFAEELLAAADGCGGAVLPWQLADILLVRLDRMSEQARRVVRVASVAGRRVSHPQLEAVAHLPASELETALREAIDTQVLQLTSSGRGYTFRHALLAEAVYDDLLPGERVRLHAAYAAAIAADPGHRAAELARHASASHDHATAYVASLAAGDEAMALAAPQEALRHFEAALELAPQVPELDTDQPGLILAAVEAAEAAGFIQRGQRLAARALAELDEDASPVARATLLYASVRAAIGNEFGEDVVATSREALDLVPAEPPSPLRARLLALHGRVMLALGRDPEAEKIVREALGVGELVGSELAITEARGSLATIERRRGDPHEAVRMLTEVVERARESGDVTAETRSRYGLANLWFELMELDRAVVAWDECYRRAVETGQQWGLYAVHARAMTGLVQYFRGEWDAALRTLDVAGESPTRTAAAILRSAAMSIRAARGDSTLLGEVDELRPLRTREGQIGLHSAYAALEIHAQHSDVDAALAVADEAVAELGRVWFDPWFPGRIRFSTLVLATLANAASSAPEARQAEFADLGARLQTEGHRSAELGMPSTRRLGPEGQAWLARLDAEAARLRWLTGRNAPSADELVDAWQAVVDAFSVYGHVYEIALARTRLAEALRAAGRSTDAHTAAAAARAAAERLGATPLVAELRSSDPARRAASVGDGFAALTDRERGVLAELVDGRSNRQIAQKLFISEKTASVHVSNILAKLKVKSRAEAAAVARSANWMLV